MARTLGQAARLRRDNLSRMLREIHVHGRASRSDLAHRMGVDRSTIAVLVEELAHRGLVLDQVPTPRSRTAPGRPSHLVELRADGPVVLALEIGTDAVAVAVVALGGRIVASTRVDRSRGGRSPAEVVADLREVAGPLLAAVGSQPVLAVGVSIPGIVRREDGVVRLAPNLEWQEVPLARLVDEAFGLGVPVLVANDADLATLAEHTRGSGVGRSDFICLWGEAGMGAGVVVGGRPLTGTAGYAGEVGHMPVNPAGQACRCGSQGCWETEVGEDALLRHAGRAAGGGREALEELFRAADADAPEAIAAIDRVAHWLAVGMVALVGIFDPSVIAMGALYARIHAYRGEAIAAEVARRAIVGSRDVVRIGAAALGPDAALLGAAELAFEPTLRDPGALAARDVDDAHGGHLHTRGSRGGGKGKHGRRADTQRELAAPARS